ncbi:MAG: UvrD/REP helicase, partial [Parcubacteria group bacterium GW2011_GWA2_47_8]
HYRSFLNPQEMEEERRLCYVGITRAKDRLYITFARRRRLFGRLQANPPSRFLLTLPEHTLKFDDSYV